LAEQALPGGSIDEGTREKVLEKTVDRADFMMTAKDVRGFLRKGQNYIVQEIENSIFGTCVSMLNIVVNGQNLEHFPQQIPDGFYVEKDVSNLPLLKKFESAAAVDTNPMKVSALDDALCARRIWEFALP
jgi:hypothetical protein